MEKIEKILSKKVKTFRAKSGMSQSDLAKKAKTSLTTINRIEKERQPPGLETLIEIARVMNCEVWELLKAPTNEIQGRDSKNELLGAAVALLSTFDESELRRVIRLLEFRPGFSPSTADADISSNVITGKKNLKG